MSDKNLITLIDTNNSDASEENNISEAQLLNNWQKVLKQVQEAKHALVDNPIQGQENSQNDSSQSTITLIAVSKTKPVTMIRTLAQAGQADFGENYLQEALPKIADLAKDGSLHNVRWHYIGHIQRNKTKDIAQNFDWIHTVERDVIAKRLNDQRPDNLENLNVLIQVNIDSEESKSGCLPSDVETLVGQIKVYARLNLRGLMIIPSKREKKSNQSDNAFARTKALFERIKQQHPELKHWDTLSMGMSADMEEAIKNGATMVRVGSAIFGERT